MTDKELGAGLLLGGRLDAGGDRSGQDLRLDPDDLTTHGVIVGMTGSGKTGLGVVLLEELLRRGIPTLILDPKGDMGNLLLNFPALRSEDFAAWVDPGEARREGLTPEELGERTASRWREGLAGWGLGTADLEALQARADLALFTPGSSAGTPLDIVGSLEAPDLSWDTDAETLRDEIEGFVSGLLGLVGINADPLTSREHILLANLVERAWRGGEALDLGTLLLQVQRPPLRKLGVFDVDTFFPERDRLGLAMRLNGLVASPSFAAWLEGPPLAIESLLWAPDGRPRAAVLYLAHLSDAERQFVVTLVLSRLITWMRAQPGSSGLRALCYMDEVYGFVPPTAAPPSKKPMLTLLKQARAFGVGVVLSTQNPVDLDYKAMSNAGTWMVGRLQTERDKARILEALRSARGDADLSALDALIGGLGKRQFLLHSARASEPATFTTRWAMSFLRGPLTRDEVRRLAQADDGRAVTDEPPAETVSADEAGPGGAPEEVAEAPAGPSERAAAASETEARAGSGPAVAAGVPVYYLDPAAPWARAVKAQAGGAVLRAALVARVSLRFDERVADLDHREEWELVVSPLVPSPEPRRGKVVDYDARDFLEHPPEGARYEVPDAPLERATYFSGFGADLARFLFERRRLELWSNRELKLYSRPGEAREAFDARCEAAAGSEADAEIAKQRERFEKRLEAARGRLSELERRAADAAADADARRQETWASGAGSLLDLFLGGRSDARSLARRAARRARGVSTQQSRASRAERRAETAADRLAELERELEAMEDELAEAALEIDARWSEKARAVEPLEVGLEKDDIHVEEVALVWFPVGEGEA